MIILALLAALAAATQPALPPETWFESMVVVVMTTLCGITVGGLLGAYFSKAAIPPGDRNVYHAVQRGRLGVAIIISVIVEILLRYHRADTGDWRTWAIVVGSGLAASGYGKLTYLAVRDRYRRWKRRNEIVDHPDTDDRAR